MFRRQPTAARATVTHFLQRNSLVTMELTHCSFACVHQELEQELEPKEAQIENLNQQLQEQDGELVEELKRASVCPTLQLTLSRGAVLPCLYGTLPLPSRQMAAHALHMLS